MNKKLGIIALCLVSVIVFQSVFLGSANSITNTNINEEEINEETSYKKLSEMTDQELKDCLTEEEYNLYKQYGEPQSEQNSLAMTFTIDKITGSDGLCSIIAYGIVIPVSERIVDYYIYYSTDNVNWIELSTTIVGAGNVRTETATPSGLYGNTYFKTIGVWDKRDRSTNYQWARQPNVVLSDSYNVPDDDNDAPSITLTTDILPIINLVDLIGGYPIAWAIADLSGSSNSIKLYNSTNAVIDSSTSAIGGFTITKFGSYKLVIDATDKDNDRIGDNKTSHKEISFTINQIDTTSPSVSIVISNLFILGTQVVITISDIDSIPPSGIKEWSIQITRNGELVVDDSREYSEKEITPIVNTYSFTKIGDYHIKVIATNFAIEPKTTEKEDDFRVFDYTPPSINFVNAIDMTDENANIVQIIVQDQQSGLSSIMIVLGLKLDIIGEWIYIPITFTSLEAINDAFNSFITTILGEYIGIDISGLIQEYLTSLIDETIISGIEEYLDQALDFIDGSFDSVITSIIDAIRNVVIDLLLDDSFIMGQETYIKSIDMRYFAYLRLFGEFQLLVTATNNDYEGHKESWLGISEIYSLTDDDITFDITEPIISGNIENITIQFTDIDASGVSDILLLTIDNIPILPCVYSINIVENNWLIEIPKWFITQGEHTAQLYLMDNDNDWLIPYIIDPSYEVYSLYFETIPPQIEYTYTGNGYEDNAGSIIFSINDNSAYTILSGQIVNDLLPIVEIEQTFTISVIDSFGNIASKSVSIILKLNITRALNQLIELCLTCDCWTKKNYQNTMIQKIYEVKSLYAQGNYFEAYDKLLHDIKPKLTGLKMDENNISYGNTDFKNAWVCSDCFESFESQINPTLHALNLLF